MIYQAGHRGDDLGAGGETNKLMQWYHASTHPRTGINSGKSAVVVWKNLPREFPRANV